MDVAALILAGLAVGLVLVIERLRRPKLDIVASTFRPSAPTPWTFAAVVVQNRPLPRLLGWVFSRDIAQGCAIQVRFEEWGREVLAIPEVPARWSSSPQPIRRVPASGAEASASASTSAGPTGISGSTVSVVMYEYDPALDPRRRDVAVSPEGEHAAVAILYPDGSPSAGAYGFGTESYMYEAWRKPEWKLARGTYRVRVTVLGSAVRSSRSFKLQYLDDDFASFVLSPA